MNKLDAEELPELGSEVINWLVNRLETTPFHFVIAIRYPVEGNEADEYRVIGNLDAEQLKEFLTTLATDYEPTLFASRKPN